MNARSRNLHRQNWLPLQTCRRVSSLGDELLRLWSARTRRIKVVRNSCSRIDIRELAPVLQACLIVRGASDQYVGLVPGVDHPACCVLHRAQSTSHWSMTFQSETGAGARSRSSRCPMYISVTFMRYCIIPISRKINIYVGIIVAF